MYKCPTCNSPRVGEKISTYPLYKKLKLIYERGCYMVLQSDGIDWEKVEHVCALLQAPKVSQWRHVSYADGVDF